MGDVNSSSVSPKPTATTWRPTSHPGAPKITSGGQGRSIKAPSSYEVEAEVRRVFHEIINGEEWTDEIYQQEVERQRELDGMGARAEEDFAAEDIGDCKGVMTVVNDVADKETKKGFERPHQEHHYCYLAVEAG